MCDINWTEEVTKGVSLSHPEPHIGNIEEPQNNFGCTYLGGPDINNQEYKKSLRWLSLCLQTSIIKNDRL